MRGEIAGIPLSNYEIFFSYRHCKSSLHFTQGKYAFACSRTFLGDKNLWLLITSITVALIKKKKKSLMTEKLLKSN